MINKASDEFVDKMIALEFSSENLQSMIRSDILGNPTYPAFQNIKPGTSAERQLIKQFQSEISKMIQETRTSRASLGMK
jgi:hypothetical protein